MVGGAVRFQIVDARLDDPHAAACDVRLGGHSIVVRGSSPFVRWVAQKLLSGVEEADAPRELTEAEKAIWVLFVATIVDDFKITGAEVWERQEIQAPNSGSLVTVQSLVAGHSCTIELLVPPALVLSAPPARVPAWADRVMIDARAIVGRCELSRNDISRLKVRSIVTLDRPIGGPIGQAELTFLGGAIGISTSPAEPLVARVTTEYIPRAMPILDDARVELTVGLGTTTLSLRQAQGLAVGEVVKLGRPLAGPFEIRAAGTLIGQGELVDVDGELGVRIVSLVQE
ncbi:MAG: FliM/FliN family flagellar motor switch protein [Kofleriaceae bacterium]